MQTPKNQCSECGAPEYLYDVGRKKALCFKCWAKHINSLGPHKPPSWLVMTMLGMLIFYTIILFVVMIWVMSVH